MSSKARLSTLTTAPEVSAVDESTDAVALILPTAGSGTFGGLPELQAVNNASEAVKQSGNRDIRTYQVCRRGQFTPPESSQSLAAIFRAGISEDMRVVRIPRASPGRGAGLAYRPADGWG